METENFIALHASGDSVGEKQGDDSFNNEHIEVKENLIDCDSDMDIEDLNEVPALRDSSCGLENNGICDLNHEPSQADCQSRITADQDPKIMSENLVKTKDGAPCEDGPSVSKATIYKNLDDNSPGLQVSASFTGAVAAAATFNGTVGCNAVQDEISVGIKKMKSNSVSGVKRTRLMFDAQNPSVCVKYNSLTRSSKHKLEELLKQWSEWHAQHALSAQDPDEALESGEETFFPALHIDLEKASSVSFWMDQQPREQQNNEFVPLDYKSVPMYDRGYALGLTSDEGTSNVEGGLEIVDDAARCFNCGSYNHALKECPKPRDNAVVNNARKQLKSKRNQNGSRNQTRYYQNSPAGKYDGLRPGALDAETRKLLGLGELDPPPWLNRMREIGYPPGYLDPDEEDQPSGITIFADDEIKEEQEDGEIVDTQPIETAKRELKMKMSVEFPGINGPIPKNADERLWADISGNRFHRRSSTSHSLEPISRGHHREERLSRSEFRDDGPPGVDQGFDLALSTHLPRYSSSYESSSNSHSPRLNSYGRPELERGRRSRFLDEGSYGSLPYLSRHSPTDYGSSRHGNWVEESRNGYDIDYSTHSSRDRQDRYRHLSRR